MTTVTDALFDVEMYKKLLLANDFETLCDELDVYRCIHNAKTRTDKPEWPLFSAEDVHCKLFVYMLRDCLCNDANQQFFHDRRLQRYVNEVVTIPNNGHTTLFVYEAIRTNNCPMISFLFSQGAVLQTLPMEYNPSLHLICSPQIGNETFLLVVSTMLLREAPPTEWARRPALLADVSLNVPKIKGLLDQGASFVGWQMHRRLDSLATLEWCFDQKFIQITNDNLMSMIAVYGRKHTAEMDAMCCNLAQHLTKINEAEARWMLSQFIHMTIPDVDLQCQTLRNVFMAVGIARIKELWIDGYPLLLYCAKYGKQVACEELVRCGVPKQQEMGHYFAKTETGQTLAREAGFLSLANWFTEKPTLIKRNDEVLVPAQTVIN